MAVGEGLVGLPTSQPASRVHPHARTWPRGRYPRNVLLVDATSLTKKTKSLRRTTPPPSSQQVPLGLLSGRYGLPRTDTCLGWSSLAGRSLDRCHSDVGKCLYPEPPPSFPVAVLPGNTATVHYLEPGMHTLAPSTSPSREWPVSAARLLDVLYAPIFGRHACLSPLARDSDDLNDKYTSPFASAGQPSSAHAAPRQGRSTR